MEEIRSPEREDSGVCRAKGAPACEGTPLAGRRGVDIGDDFFCDIMHIGFLASRALGGICACGAPAFYVDGVDCEEANPSSIYEVAQQVGNAAFFVLSRHPVLGWNHQDWCAVVAMGKDSHPLAERGTPP